MYQNIWDKFHVQVKEKMRALSDVQILLVVLCAMERQWQLYLDWTRLESAFCLQVKPETLRGPMRELLDVLWEQVWAEEPVNGHRDVYDRLFRQVEASFDEEDGQDVDFGNANLLLEAAEDAFIFFPMTEEKRRRHLPGGLCDRAAGCAASYLYRLHGDYFADRVLEQGRPADGELAPLIDAWAEKDPAWRAETARILEDLEAARLYPANRAWFQAKKEEYSRLRLLPLYGARE